MNLTKKGVKEENLEGKIIRGDIFYAELDGSLGSEQNGIRPVIVVQNNTGNIHSPTTIIVPLTKKINRKNKLPTHLNLKASGNIKYDSTILTEQIRTIDKIRIKEKIGHIENEYVMQLLDEKIKIALGIKT